MKRTSLFLVLMVVLASNVNAPAQSTAFTYQGQLTENGRMANGAYDLQFMLLSAPAGGNLVAGPIIKPAVAVSNGLFTVSLDFGASVFGGADRWLDIRVRTNGTVAPYTPLIPRQALTPAPFALQAYNAANLMSFGNAPLDIQVNGLRALRLENNGDGSDSGTIPDGAPNLIGGSPWNVVGAGVVGAVVGGGGATNYGGNAYINKVLSDFGVVGGGLANTIEESSFANTIAGGSGNYLGANSDYSTIGGGFSNRIGENVPWGFIGGGFGNFIGSNSIGGLVPAGTGNRIGDHVPYGTIIGSFNLLCDGSGLSHIGGDNNTISYQAPASTIAGGSYNYIGLRSGYSTIGGGHSNRIESWSWGSTIAGGEFNDIDDHSESSTIGGGYDNNIGEDSTGATIAGGHYNDIGTNSDYSAIGGGYDNNIAEDSPTSTIAGGEFNNIGTNSPCSVIAGGCTNIIGSNSWASAIGGGETNRIADDSPYGIIAGGNRNYIGTNADYSAVGGGYENNIANNSKGATIGGGFENNLGTNSDYSTIAGGYRNKIAPDSPYSTIAGGYDNDIGTNCNYSAIGGGINTIEDNAFAATIAGGTGNHIGVDSNYGAIGGGYGNTIADTTEYAHIGGGVRNEIGTNSSYSAIGGGKTNIVLPNSPHATIPGGLSNMATNNAFAAGSHAQAIHSGAFVWGDSTDADIASAAADSVTMRASGGVRLFTDSGASVGASLAPGSGSWTSMSDRNAKENFAAVNARTLLAKVVALPLSTWNYKSQTNGIRHIGPMAQDFKAAFGLGESDTGISTVDADGVALAAIQGLNQKLEQELRSKEMQIQSLRAELAELKALIQKEPSTSRAGDL